MKAFTSSCSLNALFLGIFLFILFYFISIEASFPKIQPNEFLKKIILINNEKGIKKNSFIVFITVGKYLVFL